MHRVMLQMVNAACIRLHYAQQRKAIDMQHEAVGNSKGGTRPSDIRNRLCQAVQKYTEKLPAGETVLLINIPAHGGSKARLAGSASIQEAVAVLTALSSSQGGTRRNWMVLLEEYKEKLASKTPESKVGGMYFTFAASGCSADARSTAAVTYTSCCLAGQWRSPSLLQGKSSTTILLLGYACH